MGFLCARSVAAYFVIKKMTGILAKLNAQYCAVSAALPDSGKAQTVQTSIGFATA